MSGQQYSDTIVVGDGDIAGNIKGRLEVDGGDEYGQAKTEDDSLVLDDHLSPGGRVATFGVDKFTQTSLPKAITWANFDHVAYTGSTHDDAVDIDAQAADHTLYVDTRGGNDVVRVGGDDQHADLGHIGKASLTVNGNSGNDSIIFNDRRAAGPHGYVLATNAFLATGTSKWTVAGFERATLVGGYGDSFVNAIASNIPVSVTTQAGSDTIIGSPFNDSIDTGYGDDQLFGGLGDDNLTGGLGRDSVYGGDGEDHLLLNDGMPDRYDGGPGDDVIDKDKADKHAD